ncbi:MAG TPA: DUF4230 domain-containing protein [Chthoniobacterales bacterium]
MNPASLEPRRRSSWPLALTLIVLIGAAVLTIIFLRLESWPARSAKQSTAELERVGRDVRDAFVEVAHLHPRITINNRVYLEKTTAAAELGILSRQIEVEHELLHTWAGSTKRVKLHGTFTAKAGFDLQQDVAVDVRPDEITVRLPHASILGVEQKQTEVLAFENGLWNRISAADLENELAALPDLARRKAAESGILVEAETALQKQLDERVQAGRHFNLVFKNPPVKE